MNRTKPGPQPLYCRSGKQHAGFIMLIVLIIISAILTVLLIGTARGRLLSLEHNNLYLSSVAMRVFAQGCADEAILQLKRNENYVGAVITSGDYSCTITVVPSGGNRTVTIDGVLNDTRTLLTIELTLSPFMVTSWDR